MLTSNLACGPMSKEIIEAVFRHSHKYGIQLMLICSRNQVDFDSGYVFTTKAYMDYIAQMEKRYPQSNVMICRDHCGPCFGTESDTLESVMSTIRCDLERGFDLIHIDLCNMNISHQERLQNTIELMMYALNIRSDVIFEIGTDENVGVAETDVDRIIDDLQFCQQAANPVFYVVQTGSFIRENCQVGSFKSDRVRTMRDVIHKCGTKLKEHNADYLTTEQILDRKGIVDAVNIAPQLGVVQTSYVLSKALIYGIDTQPFAQRVLWDRKWEKWTNSSLDFHLHTLIAGHYHFGGSEYQQLIDELSKKIDVNKGIIDATTNVIEHYLFSLGDS